jgi:ketosteroid isomerase-like protein
MKRVLVLVAISSLAVGCKKKKPEENPMPAPAPGSGSETGSATGSAGSGSAAPKALTGDDLSKRFEQCWSYFNDSKWDDFKSCYAADATYEMPGSPMPNVTGNQAIVDSVKQWKTTFPDVKGDTQLELINGHTIVAVTLITGTMEGALKTPMGELPPTKNKIGLYTTQVLDLTDAGGGQATHEAEYVDLATMMGQMKPDPKMPVRPVMDKLPMAKEVVIAKDDDKEKANLEVVKKLEDAFNGHKLKELGDVLADDAKWSEQPAPADWDKKTTLANAPQLWKGFSDLKLVVDKTWAAGDYVATVGAIEGTNDGDVAMMHIKKTGKKIHLPFLSIIKVENGKVKANWIFDQALGLAQQLGLTPPAAEPKK